MSAAAVIVTCEPEHVWPEDQAAGALAALLQQLLDLVTLMPASVYRARPAAKVSGSVGEHVRHCLDHVGALAASISGSEVSYDHRLRGTTLETDPLTAVNEIERLFVQIERLATVSAARPIRLSSLVDAEGGPLFVPSTIGREMTFLVQHTIHHYAMIALLLSWQGWTVPAGFGVAPSTARSRAHSR